MNLHCKVHFLQICLYHFVYFSLINQKVKWNCHLCFPLLSLHFYPPHFIVTNLLLCWLKWHITVQVTLIFWFCRPYYLTFLFCTPFFHTQNSHTNISVLQRFQTSCNVIHRVKSFAQFVINLQVNVQNTFLKGYKLYIAQISCKIQTVC